nr:hypothetical protein GCM10020093_102220 [Planobispora longispora]
MGEMHAAWATFDCAVFTLAHPDPGPLRDALAEDLGPDRVRPSTRWSGPVTPAG